MIVSEIVKIKKVENFDNIYIENELARVDKTPVRWAIVDISSDFLSVSVSYELN